MTSIAPLARASITPPSLTEDWAEREKFRNCFLLPFNVFSWCVSVGCGTNEGFLQGVFSGPALKVLSVEDDKIPTRKVKAKRYAMGKCDALTETFSILIRVLPSSTLGTIWAEPVKNHPVSAQNYVSPWVGMFVCYEHVHTLPWLHIPRRERESKRGQHFWMKFVSLFLICKNNGKFSIKALSVSLDFS